MTISEQFVLEGSDITMMTIHDASATGNSVGVLATGEAKVAVTQPLPAGSATIGSVVGNVAASGADSGNPLKIGGVYNSPRPTYANGQRGDFQLSTRGAMIVAGDAATGTSPTDNPVSIAGIDGNGLKRAILTTTAGQVNLAYQGAVSGTAPATVAYVGGESPTGLLVPFQTDTSGKLLISGLQTVSLANFFYDDMNNTTGGIARATNFVVGTLTTLYTHSGAGTVYGFTLNLSGLGGAQIYAIDLVLDGNHIFGANGILTSDLLSAALYDISQVTTDNLGFAGWAFPDKAIRWSVPGGGQVTYNTTVTVAVKQTAGGAGKFNAGLIALTR